jgi:C_GCAxxG_C_C family probable redox protein
MEYMRQIRLQVMEHKDDLSFNCAEGVLIQTNRAYPLQSFNESCLKIASVFGGGIGGSGKVCGAVSGAAMVLGLALGTTGNESPIVFKKQREKANALVKKFISKFTEAWGTVCCEHLKAMDEGKENRVGLQRQNQKPEEKMCDEYVEWASDFITNILKE